MPTTAARPFEPLMTLYLTDETTAAEIEAAKASGVVYACKLYPAGATTNSAAGVTDMAKIESALEAMARVGLPLLVHSEVTDEAVDIFDREAVFLERTFKPLLAKFPTLRCVMEHVTTAQGVDFVEASGPNVAATITAHHLLYNRNALLVGGVKPHMYCLPILKGEEHRQALVRAATSGNPKFFLGTDSAPHPLSAKHSACGCAGVFTAHAALALYAEAFDAAGALPQLQAFASFFGADFYGLPRNGTPGTGGGDMVKLVRRAAAVPATYPFGGEDLVPLRAGGTVAFTVEQLP